MRKRAFLLTCIIATITIITVSCGGGGGDSLVAGGGIVGCETALFLARHVKSVSIIEIW